VLAGCFALLPGAATAAEREGNALVFRLPVVPQAARHLDMLSVPSYLALALETNGLGPSLSSRMTLRDAGTFEIRTASVRYVDRAGPVFRYEGRLALAVSGAGPSLTVPVEVDTAGVQGGNIVVRVTVPLSGMIPAELLDRIEQKLRLMADLDAQRRTLEYLDEVTARTTDRSPAAVLQRIVFDAYNRGPEAAVAGPDVGGAEPLREQIALIVTLAVWGVGVPALFWWARRRQRNRAAGA
jgi:hypothetical protein